MNAAESRLAERIVAWRVRVERRRETENSLIAFGTRDQQPVVLKVVRKHGDEWRSGQMLAAFDGNGMVRALECEDGALLLERLIPGITLAGSNDIGDEEATPILADVIGRMRPGPPPSGAPAVVEWGEAFDRYLAGGDCQIPAPLIESARETYHDLCRTQSNTRLLHGDLHHANILYDSQRGWLAVDPKGVVGELAFEVGAALRNPCERPDLFTAPSTIRRRLERFEAALSLDAPRVLRWASAQSVLGAIWEIEDIGVLKVGMGWLTLARTIRQMLT